MSQTSPARQLINPATGAVEGEIADSTPGEVGDAVQKARVAFDEWRTWTASERARVLLRLADLLEEHTDELTALEVAETGKPQASVRDGEIPYAADNLRFLAGAGRSLEGTGAGVLSSGYTSLLLRRPVGVVAAITPWNFPLGDGGVEIGRCPCRRQRGGHQAGATDATSHAADRTAASLKVEPPRAWSAW